MRVWTVTELLTSRALFLEGQALRHCVASYAERCARRETSIWSMCRHGSLTSQRVLTIEVNPGTGTIQTARGKCNQPPSADARYIMELWAKREGLTLAECV